jgi:hypothetical protein
MRKLLAILDPSKPTPRNNATYFTITAESHQSSRSHRLARGPALTKEGSAGTHKLGLPRYSTPMPAVQALQRNFLYSFIKPNRPALAMAAEVSFALSLRGLPEPLSHTTHHP